ncbi:MAG TPA: type II toxin-antitoxin system Phd/YefM family antitoxin [Rhizomicrobium sp.]|nr:type II toxin-antitoxin system Phd/YefM family antitoxin [Rhizomicrobium sp.]
MKTMNLRDANQQFSKLVREIEETGEPVLVLRNGKPAIKLSAVGAHEKPEEAKQHLADPGRAFTYPQEWEHNRADVRAEAPSRPMRQVDERDVNQQLIEQVEQTGEAVEILRHGKPAAEIRPSQQRSAIRTLTPEQEAALKSMFETAKRAKPSDGIKMTRDEMHER